MYRILFDLAGFALPGWLLLIFLPRWRVTRWVAESAVFPVYLAVLYVAGVAGVLAAHGPGMMADFGSADGVVRLLAMEPVALVAWIHLLAFDQVAALVIFRDNMRRRVVPLPVQSVLLFATLMLGPLGFLAYWMLRTARTRRPGAWGEPEPPAPDAPRPLAPRFAAVVEGSGAGAAVALLRRSPALVAAGALGFAMAGATTAVAAANGGWLLGPEGRLLEAAKFDVGVGIYLLTLALLLPLAPFGERGRRAWVACTVGLALFGYGVENVQAWRGLNPRFSRVAGPLDQAVGGLFFLTALALVVLFLVLASRFARRDALPDHPALRVSVLYAAGATLLSFASGIAMSALNGRAVGPAGNLMPLHAAGIHALQAVPLAALLWGGGARLAPWVHVAGIGWLALCAGLAAQAATGHAPVAPTPALALSAAGAGAWALSLAVAARRRASPSPAPT
jgi:hypothetical protein